LTTPYGKQRVHGRAGSPAAVGAISAGAAVARVASLAAKHGRIDEDTVGGDGPVYARRARSCKVHPTELRGNWTAKEEEQKGAQSLRAE